jgi:hypothetical protein
VGQGPLQPFGLLSPLIGGTTLPRSREERGVRPLLRVASLVATSCRGAHEAASTWPGRGGVFTFEGSRSTVATVGSRSEKDGSGSALIEGAMCGMRWRCGLLDNA